MKAKAITRWTILIALCSTVGFSYGQSSKLISAASYIDNGQYQKAFDPLEAARVHEKTATSAGLVAASGENKLLTSQQPSSWLAAFL